MEYTAAPAAPRGLIRRLLPWTLALGLFAGGGVGVYSYAAPRLKTSSSTSGEGATGGAAAAVAAKSPTASAQIDKLFPSSASTVSPPAYAGANRYAAPAPQLPPMQEEEEVATPRSASAVTATQNPFSTTPVSEYGGRYSPPPANSTPQPATTKSEPQTSAPSVDSAAQQAFSAESKAVGDANPGVDKGVAEITRGQEPGSDNPLRGAATRTNPAGGAADALKATDQASIGQGKSFSAAPLQKGQTAPANLTTNIAVTSPAGSSATGGSARYSAGPGQATDVAATTAAAAAVFSRYESSRGQASAGSTPAKAPTIAEPAAAEPTLAEPPKAALIATATQPMPQATPSFTSEVQAPTSAALMSADPGLTPTPGLAAAEGAGRPGERILEGLQTPTVSIQKLAPAEIQVGKKCTFAVRVQNTSQRTAHNIQVRDEVPLGTRLVGTSPKASVSGSQVVWDLGTLSPGEERIVEMELLPTNEGELGSVATVAFAAQASAKTRCTKPELALRLSAGPRVMIGGQHLVKIEVTNPGSGDANGVMLLESVPAGVSHEAGPALEFEVGTLKPGESRQLDLVLTAEQAGRINNEMIARADASLEVKAACEFEVIAPELKVTVAGPKQRYLERPATYTMNIENPGTASAKEVNIVTQLSKGLQFVSANNYGEYDPATHSVHWSLAELPANERGAVELTALPVEPGEQSLQVATRAEQGLEDRTETRVMVEGLVALSFEVTAADGAIEVGGETAYDITVVNQGSKPAANVQVAAVIPQGLRATNGSGASRHVVQGDRVVFAPLPQLAPKAEAKFRVQVQGLRAGDLRTRIMVTADEIQEPITKEQSTRVYADQ